MNPLERTVALAALLVCAAPLAGCMDGAPSVVPVIPGGDAGRGRELVYGYTCGSCHVIPGVADANSLVGPPLTDWIERRYIAGSVPNDPEHLIRWLMSPREIEPGTAMPDLGITESEARHMAAYLYTLGDNRPLGPPHPFPVEWLERLKTTFGGSK